MASELIEMMIAAVEKGYTPRSVVETSLTFAPGSSVKVNKTTKGTDYESGAAITIPEGTVVSILGIGGGDSGVDHHVMLPNGKQAIVPFYDLGEATLQNEDLYDTLTSSVVKVTLSKPLPQGVLDWIAVGYEDYGVELPMMPSADSDSAVTFLMKAPDQATLDMAVEDLSALAGSSFKSSSPASMKDWAAA